MQMHSQGQAFTNYREKGAIIGMITHIVLFNLKDRSEQSVTRTCRC